MSKHLKTSPALIQIERLTTGTRIEVPGFGDAEVYEVLFDGEGYSVDYCTNDRGGWEALDSVYVSAGGSVEFAGLGEPVLRAESAVTDDEWAAKIEANDAASAALIAKSVMLHADTASYGVEPALQAAE